MVHLSVIEARLSKLGIRSGRLSRPELLELQHILVDNEEIVSLANGRYFAGFATLVATNVRLLIIDKRPFFMTYEDIRYDMISQLDYTASLLDATLHIFTVNKQHRFTTFRHRDQLKILTAYVQKRVMELRQHQLQPIAAAIAQDEPPQPMPAPPPPEPAPPAPPTPEPPTRTYRGLASRLSGRLLGPMAVKAVHQQHHYHIPNPYAQASLMVRHSGNWFRDHSPHPEPPKAIVQPEL